MNRRLSKLADLLKSSLGEPSQDWWSARTEEAETLRKRAIQQRREDDANAAWFLRTVASSRGEFVRAFGLMREGHYREAWDLLERIEIACMHLLRNPILSPVEFGVPTLESAIFRWQGLYPYTVFASPEYVTKRVECSICGKDVDPWEPCSHEVGKLYAGELAFRIIREAELLGLALVLDPVQKYSVILAEGVEPDYTRVQYVIERLAHPFAEWDINRTQAYHDHALFEDTGADDDCPCGSAVYAA